MLKRAHSIFHLNPCLKLEKPSIVIKYFLPIMW